MTSVKSNSQDGEKRPVTGIQVRMKQAKGTAASLHQMGEVMKEKNELPEATPLKAYKGFDAVKAALTIPSIMAFNVETDQLREESRREHGEDHRRHLDDLATYGRRSM